MYNKIIHARHDELHRLTGGKPGDQTGGEVCETDWYLHKKGWVGFRCKSIEKAIKMLVIAIAMSKDNLIGYSQKRGLFKALKKVDWDYTKLKDSYNTDCSEFMACCINCAYGKEVVPAFRTDTMGKILLETGLFEKLPESMCKSPNLLRKGDILVTPIKGHTVMVATDGGLVTEIKKPKRYNPNYTGCFKTTSDLNLRVGAGTSNRRIMTIPRGEIVTSSGMFSKDKKGADWLKVAYGTDSGEIFRGYCSKRYLR